MTKQVRTYGPSAKAARQRRIDAARNRPLLYKVGDGTKLYTLAEARFEAERIYQLTGNVVSITVYKQTL